MEALEQTFRAATQSQPASPGVQGPPVRKPVNQRIKESLEPAQL